MPRCAMLFGVTSMRERDLTKFAANGGRKATNEGCRGIDPTIRTRVLIR
jgi:hypothetical protein